MKQTKQTKMIVTTLAAALLFGGPAAVGLTPKAFADEAASSVSSDVSATAATTAAASLSETQLLDLAKQAGIDLQLNQIVSNTYFQLTDVDYIDVSDSLHSGGTLASIVAQNGGNADAVAAQIAGLPSEAIDNAVVNEQLTSDQAVQLKNLVQQKIAQAFATAGYQDPKPTVVAQSETATSKSIDLGLDKINMLVVAYTDLDGIDVQDGVKEGRSIGEIVTEAGFNAADLENRMVQYAQTNIQAALDSDSITSDQADQLLKQARDGFAKAFGLSEQG